MLVQLIKKTMDRILLLVDWAKKTPFFLENGFAERDIDYKVFDIPDYTMKDRIEKFGVINLYYKYTKLAFRAVQASTASDIIICWNFTTSIATGIACKILRKKRRILGLNIIAPGRTGILNSFRNNLFRLVMRSPDFYITINSNSYISEYSKRFKLPETKFHVLHDSIHPTNFPDKSDYEGDYIFCGGEAKRDWETLFKACRLTPDINYICIARKKFFSHELEIPSNVQMFFDLDEKQFNDYMRRSAIVALPLNSAVPAGLIVLLNAALLKKPVIVTRTSSTENYITDNETGMLSTMFDHKELASKITALHTNRLKRQALGTALHDVVLDKYSTEKYTCRLIDILHEIDWLPDIHKNLKKIK